MYRADRMSRRRLLQQLLLGVPLAGVIAGSAQAAGDPLVATDSPEAKALGYVEDAKASREAQGSNHCGDCALFQGASAAAQGPCQIFPGKQVKAAGWCRSWAPQM
jgi:High potential iron-sulfur protein